MPASWTISPRSAQSTPWTPGATASPPEGTRPSPWPSLPGTFWTHLLGFSDGGNIALTFALAHQERIRRLVLNGANLSPAGVKVHVQIPIVLGWRIASLFARRSPQARQNAEILGLMVKEPHINPAALSALRVPTLVIVGTRDMIRDRHTQSIAASLPNARLERIPGDHFIAAKNPEAFNRAVEAFLAD